jgi:hypothetical protein
MRFSQLHISSVHAHGKLATKPIAQDEVSVRTLGQAAIDAVAGVLARCGAGGSAGSAILSILGKLHNLGCLWPLAGLS